jgi:endonuclease YncB( thermonuclease family)
MTMAAFTDGWKRQYRRFVAGQTSSHSCLAEAAAREEKVGLWRGEFMMPEKFRQAAGIFVERP